MKIISLSGILGYGYSKEALNNALKEDIDCIGVDGGSSDPGPNFLGQGKSFTERANVKRDVKLSLPHAIKRDIPFIVGTAGGAGGEPHLQWTKEIFEEVAHEENLSYKMALIHTEISKDYVESKYKKGEIRPLKEGFELTKQDINNSHRIVSQIGVEPYIKALENGADVILAGRSCDSAIFAALPIKKGYDPGLALHMAKIIECGAMCTEPLSASDVIIADLKEDSFILKSPNPIRKCTIKRVAAHSLYEQPDPNYIYEPSGKVNLSNSKYEKVREGLIRVSNSQFEPTNKPTIKIEGVKLVGYRTISIGGIRENEMIKRLDEILNKVKKKIQEETNISKNKFKLLFRKYGINGVAGEIESHNSLPHEVGIVIDVVGKTQEIADDICALTRANLLHYDYVGRKTTAGNLAFPYSPSDIPVGPVYNFNIYHLLEVENLNETSSIEYIKVGE